VVDGRAYPTISHPDGARDEPWYRIEHAFVYATAACPSGASDEVRFKIVGSFVYDVAGPSAGPWFQIVDREC
jgi:hypothetical protein